MLKRKLVNSYILNRVGPICSCSLRKKVMLIVSFASQNRLCRQFELFESDAEGRWGYRKASIEKLHA